MTPTIEEKLINGLCMWFAGCANQATGTREHPVLGAVPICDRCRAKLERIEKETK